MPLPDYDYYSERQIFGDKYQYITLLVHPNVSGYDVSVFTDYPSISEFNARKSLPPEVKKSSLFFLKRSYS